MKTVREMFVSLTAMLINHILASIIEICVEKWRTQSLKKIEIQMSRHEKRYRSEEIAPAVDFKHLIPGSLWQRFKLFLNPRFKIANMSNLLCEFLVFILCGLVPAMPFRMATSCDVLRLEHEMLTYVELCGSIRGGNDDTLIKVAGRSC